MNVGGNRALNSDINVTPFVDICLVLLIIFMVVTPMLQEGIQINLPYAKNTEKHEDDEAHAIVVAIKGEPNGSIATYVSKKPIPRDQYQAEMTEIHDRTPDKSVLIKADRAMKYGDVRKVMIETNEAGFNEVSLVSEKLPGSSEP
ncbi:MAG TPA: biopolymer transporter ExbD [Candidatus Polarisedimenticolia bacterium]|nr:biopolymer transporter ExbD [Candidatus Polarisedimenticolia bacterium]